MAIDSIQLTPAQIAKYRAELANNYDALAALDVIEEWDGDLANATESLATRNGIEGVKDNADIRWFAELLQKCRKHICNPQYADLREKYIPALIPPITDFIAASVGCPPGIAGIIATPVAIYIQDEGMDKFCQTSPNP
jgi:hypothetical protein